MFTLLFFGLNAVKATIYPVKRRWRSFFWFIFVNVAIFPIQRSQRHYFFG